MIPMVVAPVEPEINSSTGDCIKDKQRAQISIWSCAVKVVRDGQDTLSSLIRSSSGDNVKQFYRYLPYLIYLAFLKPENRCYASPRIS